MPQDGRPYTLPNLGLGNFISPTLQQYSEPIDTSATDAILEKARGQSDEVEKNTGLWTQFFSNLQNNPALSQALIQGGAAMLAPGRTQGERIARGLSTGGQVFSQQSAAARQEQRQAKRDKLQERSLQEQIRFNTNREGQAETRLGLERERLNTSAEMEKKRLALEARRVTTAEGLAKVKKKYYDTLLKQTSSGGGGGGGGSGGAGTDGVKMSTGDAQVFAQFLMADGVEKKAALREGVRLVEAIKSMERPERYRDKRIQEINEFIANSFLRPPQSEEVRKQMMEDMEKGLGEYARAYEKATNITSISDPGGQTAGDKRLYNALQKLSANPQFDINNPETQLRLIEDLQDKYPGWTPEDSFFDFQ